MPRRRGCTSHPPTTQLPRLPLFLAPIREGNALSCPACPPDVWRELRRVHKSKILPLHFQSLAHSCFALLHKSETHPLYFQSSAHSLRVYPGWHRQRSSFSCSPLATRHSPLSPVESALTNFAPVSPLQSALTKKERRGDAEGPSEFKFLFSPVHQHFGGLARRPSGGNSPELLCSPVLTSLLPYLFASRMVICPTYRPPTGAPTGTGVALIAAVSDPFC